MASKTESDSFGIVIDGELVMMPASECGHR